MSDRIPFVAGNWKMFKTQADAEMFISGLLPLVSSSEGIDVAICVPFTDLQAMVDSTRGSRVQVFAQSPAALEAGLVPILCVGETEAERDAGDTERKLRHQVQHDLANVPDERLADVVIAYEPIWAIGTGKVATPEQAQEACHFVRALVADRSPEAAARLRVQYGGSVKPDNAAELLGLPDVDGALVGGAALEPASFAAIVEAGRSA